MTGSVRANDAIDRKNESKHTFPRPKIPQSAVEGLARILPLCRYVNTDANSAASLIEILSLCEKTLAAFDLSNGTHDPLPVPVKVNVLPQRRQVRSAHRFELIRGGLDQAAREPKSR
jgi:hypothetical protein